MTSQAELDDPDALSAFISTLISFNADLQGRASNLNGAWGSLFSAWRDPQAARFSARWDEVYPVIERYLGRSDDYVKYLQGVLEKTRGFAS